jgi:hypothetical protein
MSDTGAALASGRESRFVVDALTSVLDGQGATAQAQLLAGAEATSWTDVLHRLDVAGRALALDAALTPFDVPVSVDQVAALASTAGVDRLPAGAAAVLGAWSRGHGLPVPIDLTIDRVDTSPETDCAWAAALVLAWLVGRSGFPPQVVA